MFVQVIQGGAKDAAALRSRWADWDQTLKAGARGFLGGTAGVATDGQFVAVVRFQDEATARANSDRTEQDAWWTETSQHLDAPRFSDFTVIDLLKDGGSDDAGFVQVIQGAVTDNDKARELDSSMRDHVRDTRPDLIGGLTAWRADDGAYVSVIYFTSESEARAEEAKMADDPDAEKYMAALADISRGEPTYLDVTEPWYSTGV
jgi:hypothetical protein